MVEGRAVLLDQPAPLSLVQNPEVVDMLPPETTQEPRTHGLGLAFASGARGLGLAFASLARKGRLIWRAEPSSAQAR